MDATTGNEAVDVRVGESDGQTRVVEHELHPSREAFEQLEALLVVLGEGGA